MNTVDQNAKIIWDYMSMKQKPQKCDAVFVLGSLDERVAEYGAELFLKGFGDWLILSGGSAHKNDLLKTVWEEETEADHFASIARSKGVPEEKIITENKSQNTGENIRFVHEILKQRGLQLHSFLLLQKPYMERRTYATFMKQWPEDEKNFIVSSPPIPFETYFTEESPKEKIINIMVGDLDRIAIYPKLGFQIEQEIPKTVWQAFEELVAAGYTKHLVAK